jgi:hypothetical protein
MLFRLSNRRATDYIRRGASTMSSTSASTPSFTGSSILRQSPPFHPSSHTGPGGADLSLSELCISDRWEDGTVSKPFSLLPQRDTHHKEPEDDDDDAVSVQGGLLDGAAGGDEVVVDKGKRSLNETRTREERLQHDLFVLKKLNASFSVYNEALNDARSSTEVSFCFADCTSTSSQKCLPRMLHSSLIGQVAWWTNMSICCDIQKTTRNLYSMRPGKGVRWYVIF